VQDPNLVRTVFRSIIAISRQPSAMTGNAECCSAGGAEIKLDGRDYLIVKEQEVFAVIARSTVETKARE